ncbi:MAG: hypothetical protein QCI82_08100 [Candidatus Thermoplasmatota archaeon]|nr:hypothetical protein [Candidatus Thermoplasmatota archaeon]
MAFESIRKFFKFGSASAQAGVEEERKHLIDSELDSFERDIQEYLDYTQSHDRTAGPEMPPKFAQGGGIAQVKPEKEA